MQRRRVMLAAWKRSELPPGYTRLNYISNPNGAYIEPDILWFKGGIFTIKFCYPSVEETNSRTLFGYRYKGNYAAPYQAFATKGGLKTRYIVIGVSASASGVSQAYTLAEKHELIIDSEHDVVYLDGEPATFSYSTSIGTMFDENGSSVISPPLLAYTVENSHGIEIGYKFQIFEYSVSYNGNFAAKMLPCINPDGTYGMYDTARKRFFGSANGKTFEGG